MRFALITEGISEHRIIKHILEKYYKDSDTYFRQIQPQIFNEKQISGGGWLEVLKYCTREDDLNEIFNNNDYLVIQIDTDQSQTKPFDVSHTKSNNRLKTIEELYADIIEKLKSLIRPDIIEEHGHKIFFAVSIHTIECWLLPLYYNNNHKSDIGNCLFSLNKELKKKNIHPIPQKDKNNPISIRSYETILRNWGKKQDIINSAKHNFGFIKFVESLRIIGYE